MTRNVEMLLAAARAFGELRDEVVFVGGAVVDLLVTDPAAPRPRFTDDVDVVVEVTTQVEWYALGERLRKLGFAQLLPILCPNRVASCRSPATASDTPIKMMPFRTEEVGRDRAYDELVAAGCAAVPCLVETIGSGKRMADPRQAPIFPGFRVGDAALFMAARITGRPYDASLPAEIRAQIAQEGVQAYFKYVDGTSRRQAIRDDWRRWLAAHPQCR